MMGVPFVGADALTLGLALDKVMAKQDELKVVAFETQDDRINAHKEAIKAAADKEKAENKNENA